jgi:hypothetical protein
MKKTQIAFQMSTERLAERGRLYFWTFTFKEKLDIVETRKRWNHLLTLMKRRWPNLCGLRVYELHKSHGLHVHLLTDRFIDVNTARTLASRAGWGRIHVQRIPATKAGYLGKYLSKERPECFKRWRLWAAFGKDWTATKVGNLEKRSAFSTVYHHFKEKFEWEGNTGFYHRMKMVQRALDFEIRTASTQAASGRPTQIREKLLADGSVILL